MYSKIPCRNRFRAQGLPLGLSAHSAAHLAKVAAPARCSSAWQSYVGALREKFSTTRALKLASVIQDCIPRQSRSTRSQHARACVRGNAWPASATMASALLGSSSRNSSARSTGTTRSRLPCKMSICAAAGIALSSSTLSCNSCKSQRKPSASTSLGPAVPVRRRTTTGVKIGQ